ncbi:DUF262 domain-containing protein [Moheibacter stercoris]|uniref:GmrSD restriction endonucleases N-terminal domain-containing protein n=1 Tax=Moheibacter stercoris TaxID=1628251 RepID=A0ABV2LVM4_9FLAO
MKNQQLKEQSLLFLLSQNNFIVPEIQREYVWGNNPDVLNRFLDSIIDKIGDSCDVCGNPESSLKINVGFLYTYKPSYVNYNYERFLDENLIDGQQRFTTLFLLLFYTALKEERLEDFKDALRFEDYQQIAFDYKVRNLTHIFILDLISKVDSLEKLRLILRNEASWMLNDFKQDVTVLSMIQALKIIDSKFQARKEKYFAFILNNIKFYHFKTEATNQGEELYITMNARGEALSKNEENKAALMFDDANIFEYGKKWEEWQDFFWKHRNKSESNSNSDVGLNEFLRWIQVIEMTLRDNDFDTDEDEKIDDKSFTKSIITLIQGEKIHLDKAYFSIEKIEKYFKALEYLFKVYDADKSFLIKYDSICDNLITKEWLSPSNKVLSQIDCFKFIPILHYVNKLLETNRKVNNQNVFRLFRYLSNLTHDKTITKTINKQVINAIKLVDNLLKEDDDITKVIKLEKGSVSKSLLTPEEHFKFSIYLQNQNREHLESAFWNAEDNNILKGKISPLLQFSYFVDNSNEFEHLKSFDVFNPLDFDLNKFTLLFSNFQKLTSEDNEKISDNIWGTLMLTDYYQVKDYNDTHKIIVCENSDDFHLIRNKRFLSKLIEIDNFKTSEDYFQNIFNQFLSKYSTLDDLKNETDLKRQLYAYYIVLKNLGNWHFGKGKNFGVYLNPSRFNSFFELNVRYQHYRQKWQGADYNYFDDNKKHINKFYSQLLKPN